MILIHTRIKGDFFSKRAWTRAMKAAHEHLGAYWHKFMLPRHFRTDAREKYNHEPRTFAYLRRKEGLGYRKSGKVKYAGKIDNVYSGLMEETLKGQGTVRAFPSRVTINMQGPRYITMRPHESNQPDKAAEILRCTSEEDLEMARVFDAELQKQLTAEERRRR